MVDTAGIRVAGFVQAAQSRRHLREIRIPEDTEIRIVDLVLVACVVRRRLQPLHDDRVPLGFVDVAAIGLLAPERQADFREIVLIASKAVVAGIQTAEMLLQIADQIVAARMPDAPACLIRFGTSGITA